MKTIFIKITIAVTTLLSVKADSQGFVNLNFEAATITQAVPPFATYIFASNAIPGWTAYLGGTPQDIIGYSSVSLGGAYVFLEDTNASSLGYAPLQGAYSVLLQGGSSTYNPPSYQLSAAIGQTGTIPISAQSLTFWGNVGGMQITFGGQLINFAQTGSTANYNIYSADISAFAGQSGQLLFTALGGEPYVTGGLLDNIQFSATPVPEPGTLALVALGGLLVGLVKNRQRWQF